MSVRLLTENYWSLKGDCTGSPESTFVKMPHCWKSRVVAHIMLKIRSRASMFVTIFALPFNMQTVQTTGIEVFDVNLCASY